MFSWRATAGAALALLVVLAVPPAPAAAAPDWPETIDLGSGYRPEGIAAASGTSVFVGSIPTGAVSVVDVRTGAVDSLVPARPGERMAIGLEEAGGVLFVAGGSTGKAFLYDARTGADIATLVLNASTPTFVNDVVVTHDAAWFTDSRTLVLSRVDRRTLEVTQLPVTGVVLEAGNNLNGIEASPNGRTLYSVQSSTGDLWEIDATTGAATHITGGLENGDGLLRQGNLVYVVQNRLNQIAIVDLRTNEIVDTITSPLFQVPTTVARVGSRLYLPNAKFGSAEPDTISYEVVAIG
jgi:sugar lactone lactonase YvrE